MNGELPRVEERVRSMLDRHAAQAPRGDAMLGAVEREARRRSRKRRSTVGITVAALTLVAFATGATATRIGTWWPAAQTVSSAAAVRFVAGSVDVTVPFRLPTPYEYADPVGTVVGGRPALTMAPQVDGLGPITVEVLDEPPTALAPKLATVAPRWLPGGSDADQLVWWTAASPMWVKLSVPASYPAVFRTKLLDSIDRTQSMRVTTAVRFDTVPDGFTVDNLDASLVSFCPPGVAPGPGTEGKLVISWPPPGTTLPPSDGTQQTSTLNVSRAGDGSMLVTVDSAASGPMLIRVPPTVTITLDDLLRFAAGIHRQA